MRSTADREIPYNYTSADDRRVAALILGKNVLPPLERLMFKRRTGRSWRLLMRFIGDLFIHHRNPFLYQELIDNKNRRRRFLAAARKDLLLIAERSREAPDVGLVLDLCRRRLDDMAHELGAVSQLRSRVRHQLGAIVGEANVFFDPFTLNAHVTDATDWRLYPPIAVVRPETEIKVPTLIKAIAKLGLKVVPRGAGTGLTGGAVPVANQCIIINTEKLNHIGPIREQVFETPDGESQSIATIELGAGVITDEAIQTAHKAGLVFATDPTSAWACTIGGNVAENAGGKKAVLWGTAIDNLLSFRLATPDGGLLEIKRNHPTGRRIDSQESISFSVIHMEGHTQIQQISLHGSQIRKPGLGKDITNKALEGLPGIQKEGTDGIITSAVFILHPAYACQRTVCLEFFGEDMDEAGRIITQISDAFVNTGQEVLMALEHFDEEYVQAIDYKTKAPRPQTPKAVLLADIVGHTPSQVDTSLAKLTALLTDYPNTFMAVAGSRQESERYWRDRKRLGAIAARTNAFKLNEDIVLPIDTLAEFAEFVDQLNVEEERRNQEEVIYQLIASIEKAEPAEDPQWLDAKLPQARQLLQQAMRRIKLAGRTHLRAATHIHHVVTAMAELLRGFSKVKSELDQDIGDIRNRRIVVATHMHAGDGNVHVNIPVFSNDHEMMRRAAEVADMIMERAVALGGVVSGEHGIGFTKIKHLDDDKIASLKQYLRQVDPDNLVNPGKLTDPGVADLVFAPSFNLIELEARILRYGRLEQMAEKISQCVRCGKCKIDCCVFFPDGNLFYHPRNKNLALTAIIEALLYDAQRLHTIGLRPLRWLKEIADHCTLCHKCQTPCPVNIDTAEVSVLEREVLARRHKNPTALPTRVVLGYLASRSQLVNRFARKALLQWGGWVQRVGARLAGDTFCRPRRTSWLGSLYAPAPPIAAKSMPALLSASNLNHALVLNPVGTAQSTVFYYPGCGSERLHTDIALAAIFLLVRADKRIVLPPNYLCCGFPARANAKTDLCVRQELRNTIIFTQIRSMLGHLDFDACVLSCGTCLEALKRIRSDVIFDAPVVDIAQYVLTAGLEVKLSGPCDYHVPCHDSLQGQGMALLSQLTRHGVAINPHCCSEAGTLALSRPDIAAAMLARKRSAVQVKQNAKGTRRQLITNCPACLNGLGRQVNTQPQHLAVALADAIDPLNWRRAVLEQLTGADRIRF